MIFGAMSAFNNLNFLSVILLTIMFLGFLVTYYLFKNQDIEIPIIFINIGLCFLELVLVVTGGVNNTGMLWVYPIMAILIFVNGFAFGSKIAISLVAINALILLTPICDYIPAEYSHIEVIRFLIALAALCIMCLVEVSSEEKAYDMIVKLHNDDVHRLMFYDPLTGLSNRLTLQYNLKKILTDSKKQDITALLFIDLDNFKLVNDNYGHERGDKLLHHFGNQLKDIVRPFDLITQNVNFENINDDAARLAGDEFVIVLTRLKNTKEAAIVAKRILGMFDGGYQIEKESYPVYASIGIAISPDDSIEPEKLIHYSDAAMYEARRKGNNNYVFFSKDIATKLQQKQRIELGLKEALRDDSFHLVYLPIFDCKNEEIIGVEALIRCKHPNLKNNGPESYIPVAESIGIIKEIDLWVIENSIKEFLEIKSITRFKGRLNINISGTELLDADFPEQIKYIFDQYNFSTSEVDLEIIETALVPDNQVVIKNLNELRRLGFNLALDDFGTGYTSFNQLILFPSDSLKIDRTFVKNLFSENESNQKTVEIIHNLAKNYKLKVVAEGVETVEQLEYLKSIGCNFVQGYYLSSPIEKEKLVSLIRIRNKSRLAVPV